MGGFPPACQDEERPCSWSSGRRREEHLAQWPVLLQPARTSASGARIRGSAKTCSPPRPSPQQNLAQPRVHPVLGAMGLSGLELWEAEPTVWSSIFLNVPSATALRSEGEAESASVLAWRSVTSTSAPGRWLLRPVSLTPSGWSRPAPRGIDVQGRQDPHRGQAGARPAAGRAPRKVETD